MTLILVVGPSGAGKDSLIRGAREFFAPGGEINFVRRYITRPPDGSEDNYSNLTILLTSRAAWPTFPNCWRRSAGGVTRERG